MEGNERSSHKDPTVNTVPFPFPQPQPQHSRHDDDVLSSTTATRNTSPGSGALPLSEIEGVLQDAHELRTHLRELVIFSKREKERAVFRILQEGFQIIEKGEEDCLKENEFSHLDLSEKRAPSDEVTANTNNNGTGTSITCSSKWKGEARRDYVLSRFFPEVLIALIHLVPEKEWKSSRCRSTAVSSNEKEDRKCENEEDRKHSDTELQNIKFLVNDHQQQQGRKAERKGESGSSEEGKSSGEIDDTTKEKKLPQPVEGKRRKNGDLCTEETPSSVAAAKTMMSLSSTLLLASRRQIEAKFLSSTEKELCFSTLLTLLQTQSSKKLFGALYPLLTVEPTSTSLGSSAGGGPTTTTTTPPNTMKTTGSSEWNVMGFSLNHTICSVSPHLAPKRTLITTLLSSLLLSRPKALIELIDLLLFDDRIEDRALAGAATGIAQLVCAPPRLITQPALQRFLLSSELPEQLQQEGRGEREISGTKKTSADEKSLEHQEDSEKNKHTKQSGGEANRNKAEENLNVCPLPTEAYLWFMKNQIMDLLDFCGQGSCYSFNKNEGNNKEGEEAQPQLKRQAPANFNSKRAKKDTTDGTRLQRLQLTTMMILERWYMLCCRRANTSTSGTCTGSNNICSGGQLKGGTGEETPAAKKETLSTDQERGQPPPRVPEENPAKERRTPEDTKEQKDPGENPSLAGENPSLANRYIEQRSTGSGDIDSPQSQQQCSIFTLPLFNRFILSPAFGVLRARRPATIHEVLSALQRLYGVLEGSTLTASNGVAWLIWESVCPTLVKLYLAMWWQQREQLDEMRSMKGKHVLGCDNNLIKSNRHGDRGGRGIEVVRDFPTTTTTEKDDEGTQRTTSDAAAVVTTTCTGSKEAKFMTTGVAKGEEEKRKIEFMDENGNQEQQHNNNMKKDQKKRRNGNSQWQNTFHLLRSIFHLLMNCFASSSILGRKEKLLQVIFSAFEQVLKDIAANNNNNNGNKEQHQGGNIANNSNGSSCCCCHVLNWLSCQASPEMSETDLLWEKGFPSSDQQQQKLADGVESAGCSCDCEGTTLNDDRLRRKENFCLKLLAEFFVTEFLQATISTATACGSDKFTSKLMKDTQSKERKASTMSASPTVLPKELLLSSTLTSSAVGNSIETTTKKMNKLLDEKDDKENKDEPLRASIFSSTLSPEMQKLFFFESLERLQKATQLTRSLLQSNQRDASVLSSIDNGGSSISLLQRIQMQHTTHEINTGKHEKETHGYPSGQSSSFISSSSSKNVRVAPFASALFNTMSGVAGRGRDTSPPSLECELVWLSGVVTGMLEAKGMDLFMSTAAIHHDPGSHSGSGFSSQAAAADSENSGCSFDYGGLLKCAAIMSELHLSSSSLTTTKTKKKSLLHDQECMSIIDHHQKETHKLFGLKCSSSSSHRRDKNEESLVAQSSAMLEGICGLLLAISPQLLQRYVVIELPSAVYSTPSLLHLSTATYSGSTTSRSILESTYMELSNTLLRLRAIFLPFYKEEKKKKNNKGEGKRENMSLLEPEDDDDDDECDQDEDGKEKDDNLSLHRRLITKVASHVMKICEAVMPLLQDMGVNEEEEEEDEDVEEQKRMSGKKAVGSPKSVHTENSLNKRGEPKTTTENLSTTNTSEPSKKMAKTYFTISQEWLLQDNNLLEILKHYLLVPMQEYRWNAAQGMHAAGIISLQTVANNLDILVDKPPLYRSKKMNNNNKQGAAERMCLHALELNARTWSNVVQQRSGRKATTTTTTTLGLRSSSSNRTPSSTASDSRGGGGGGDWPAEPPQALLYNFPHNWDAKNDNNNSDDLKSVSSSSSGALQLQKTVHNFFSQEVLPFALSCLQKAESLHIVNVAQKILLWIGLFRLDDRNCEVLFRCFYLILNYNNNWVKEDEEKEKKEEKREGKACKATTREAAATTVTRNVSTSSSMHERCNSNIAAALKMVEDRLLSPMITFSSFPSYSVTTRTNAVPTVRNLKVNNNNNNDDDDEQNKNRNKKVFINPLLLRFQARILDVILAFCDFDAEGRTLFLADDARYFVPVVNTDNNNNNNCNNGLKSEEISGGGGGALISTISLLCRKRERRSATKGMASNSTTKSNNIVASSPDFSSHQRVLRIAALHVLGEVLARIGEQQLSRAATEGEASSLGCGVEWSLDTLCEIVRHVFTCEDDEDNNEDDNTSKKKGKSSEGSRGSTQTLQQTSKHTDDEHDLTEAEKIKEATRMAGREMEKAAAASMLSRVCAICVFPHTVSYDELTSLKSLASAMCSYRTPTSTRRKGSENFHEQLNCSPETSRPRGTSRTEKEDHRQQQQHTQQKESLKEDLEEEIRTLRRLQQEQEQEEFALLQGRRRGEKGDGGAHDDVIRAHGRHILRSLHENAQLFLEALRNSTEEEEEEVEWRGVRNVSSNTTVASSDNRSGSGSGSNDGLHRSPLSAVRGGSISGLRNTYRRVQRWLRKEL